MTFEEWQQKHGPNGGAYDIEMMRAGWDAAMRIEREANSGNAEATKVIASTLKTTGKMIYETHGLDTQQMVFFYEHDFYCLSNFSAFTLMWKNLRFDTSEAAYHYEKFPDNPFMQHSIRTAESAHEAYKFAERNKSERRHDWDNVKVDIMLKILREKVRQHEYVKRKLLSTGDRTLVEDSWRDSFWGWGKHIDGQNMLGKLWMQVRAELRNPHKVTETLHQQTETNEQRKG